MNRAGWLPIAALALALLTLNKAPAIDEESYLWLGDAIPSLARPYDWSRLWQPFDINGYVYAHPPLHLWWMKLWSSVELPLVRLSGLPWVIGLAGGVAWLARRTCLRPDLAAGLWLASPIVLLGLQDTLMIDLPAAALMTLAFAAWREGEEGEDRWFLLAGLFLGLGLITKYPVGFVLPVLAIHARRPGWYGIAVALAVWLGVELYLWAQYGSVHLWEVWSRREEIAHGGALERWIGVFSRMALLPLGGADTWIFALVSGGFCGLFGPEDYGLWLGVLGAAGGLIIGTLLREMYDRDGRLLGLWALAVIVGVGGFHNYASARYLLPAAAPVALLLARNARALPIRVGIAVSGLLAVALSVADYIYVNAAYNLGQQAVAWVEAEGGQPGRFAGEWSFRYALEQAGWSALAPNEPLSPGSYVIVGKNASPGALQTTAWEPVRTFSGPEMPLRVVAPLDGVGLYAETLGPLPFGWLDGPVEEVLVYKVQP